MAWGKVVLWLAVIVVLVVLGFMIFGNGDDSGPPNDGIGDGTDGDGGGEVIIEDGSDSVTVDVDTEIANAIIEEEDDLDLGDVI
jgi:hypothetical protein